MLRRNAVAAAAIGLLSLLAFAPAHGFDINKSVKIEAGSETGGHSTVNGSITVGDQAIVTGAVETVNGTIRVGDSARIEDAQTVNGSIRLANGVIAEDVGSVNGSVRLGANVVVDGEISVVNGKIGMEQGTSVARDVSNVNGEISIAGAEIGGDLSTVNGDVSLSDGATVRGDLVVEKPGGWGWKDDDDNKPRVVIGPGSQVIGEIRLEREVELFISETASVGSVTGEMSMDDAVRFSGNRP